MSAALLRVDALVNVNADTASGLAAAKQTVSGIAENFLRMFPT